MNIQVSTDFKKMTSKAIFAIGLFLLVYIILLILAIGLTILSVIGGISLIVIKPMVLTIGLGVGLASLGFFVLAFLFKFIFKEHKIDRSHLTEITREQEPKLFAIIDEIVKEVETDFPKNIYLSADVNACVFYDSSFWSMFFPIKKNLQIGLGLVNTTTEQEFKAILAHEFGHFSQKSMKVGSYVYNVNQVIYNMLYDNESFEGMIQTWASISGYFSIFVLIAVKIIQGIQWILRKMYAFVNISYMALSREMEFHADEVAANVAGYLPLKESLLRMELADHSFNSVISFYNNKISENIKSQNIFKEQSSVMNFLAEESNIPFKEKYPLVSELDLSKYNKSKLNIKNQWASHPSVEERAKKLVKLNIVKEEPSTSLANELFTSIEKSQEQFTDKLFSKVKYAGSVSAINPDEFRKEFVQQYKKNTFDKKFNGYYDNKNPNYFEIEKIEPNDKSITFESVFSKEKIDQVYDYIALESDKRILLNILIENELSVKTFDYAGQRYTLNDASKLLPVLEKEIKLLKSRITENDIAIYAYFYARAKIFNRGDELKEKYIRFFKSDREYDKKVELHTKLVGSTRFVNAVTPYEQIEINFREIKKTENELKKEISILVNQEQYKSEITKEMSQNFENYLSNDLVYFKNPHYREDSLQTLFTALNDYNYLLSRIYFLDKKDLLDFKCELIEMSSDFKSVRTNIGSRFVGEEEYNLQTLGLPDHSYWLSKQ